MTKRSILFMVLMSILTFGIYSIFWTAKTVKELNNIKPEPEIRGVILLVIFSILTFGIYAIFWNIKFYKKAALVTGSNDYIVKLILLIFIITAWIPPLILQSEINKIGE